MPRSIRLILVVLVCSLSLRVYAGCSASFTQFNYDASTGILTLQIQATSSSCLASQPQIYYSIDSAAVGPIEANCVQNGQGWTCTTAPGTRAMTCPFPDGTHTVEALAFCQKEDPPGSLRRGRTRAGSPRCDVNSLGDSHLRGMADFVRPLHLQVLVELRPPDSMVRRVDHQKGPSDQEQSGEIDLPGECKWRCNDCVERWRESANPV